MRKSRSNASPYTKTNTCAVVQKSEEIFLYVPFSLRGSRPPGILIYATRAGAWRKTHNMYKRSDRRAQTSNHSTLYARGGFNFPNSTAKKKHAHASSSGPRCRVTHGGGFLRKQLANYVIKLALASKNEGRV